MGGNHSCHSGRMDFARPSAKPFAAHLILKMSSIQQHHIPLKKKKKKKTNLPRTAPSPVLHPFPRGSHDPGQGLCCLVPSPTKAFAFELLGQSRSTLLPTGVPTADRSIAKAVSPTVLPTCKQRAFFQVLSQARTLWGMRGAGWGDA